MSCVLPVPRMARALKVFLLAHALVVSSELQLVHFGGEPEGQRQQVPVRGFDEQGSKSRIFPTLKSPGVLSAPLSVSSSFRGKPTSRLARALSLRPVGWEEGAGKSSAAVAVQGGEASALLEVTATTPTYERLGHGLCACRNPTQKNGLDLCNSEVLLRVPAAPAPRPEKDNCSRICSDAADCMAYQDTADIPLEKKTQKYWLENGAHCMLWLWHRVPIGVFGLAEIDKLDLRHKAKEYMLLWRYVPCMRKVVQLTDRRSRFPLESVEKFAIMPRERDRGQGGASLPHSHKDRFCTCRATTPTGGDDTEAKETVCRVADEKENMSQEAAESLCLERNRREAMLRGSTNEKDRESADRGCAGFMSFTHLLPDQHPKAKHVLFFSGYQKVTGIAATKEQYEQKGGPKTGPARLYLMPDGTWPNADAEDSIGGFEVAGQERDYNLPRCVYYVGDNHGRPAGPGSRGAGQTERMEVSGNLGQAERMEVLFNVAVGGVAVFSIALLVVAVFLVAACRKHQKSRRALGDRDAGKDRKAKQELRSRDQTNRDGPEGAARVHDEKAPQTPTLPLAPVPEDEKDKKPTTPTRKKESAKKRDHAGAPPRRRRAGAPSARQVRDVAEDVDRGFPTRYADYRIDVRDQQPLPLQGNRLRAVRAIGIDQGVEADQDSRGAPLALGMNNDPVAFPEPLSTGEVGREGGGSATSGTRQVLERATRAAVSSASLSLVGQYEAQPEELLLGRGDGEIDADWLLALASNPKNGDGASCTDAFPVPVAPVNSSVTGRHSRPTSETPEGTSWS